MHGTIIIDSNNKLAFQAEIDNAITERLIDIEFLNAYINDVAKLGIKTTSGGLYKQITTYYKYQGFHDTYKSSMRNILLDTFEKEFPNVKNITKDLENIDYIDKDFIIFPEIRRRAIKYLVNTHEIYKLFTETYERVNISKQTPFDYLSLSNVLTYLTTTEYYKNLSATMKKKTTLPYPERLFRNNKLLRQN